MNRFGVDSLKAVIVINATPKTAPASGAGPDWVWNYLGDRDGFRQWLTMGPLEDRPAHSKELAKWMLDDCLEYLLAPRLLQIIFLKMEALIGPIQTFQKIQHFEP